SPSWISPACRWWILRWPVRCSTRPRRCGCWVPRSCSLASNTRCGNPLGEPCWCYHTTVVKMSNLTLACESCNVAKGNRTAQEYGHAELQAKAKAPLKDAAASNATRWALYRRLVATGLPIEVGTGGRTKYNRTRQGLEKTHWLDAACVGASTPPLLQLGSVRS